MSFALLNSALNWTQHAARTCFLRRLSYRISNFENVASACAAVAALLVTHSHALMLSLFSFLAVSLLLFELLFCWLSLCYYFVYGVCRCHHLFAFASPWNCLLLCATVLRTHVVPAGLLSMDHSCLSSDSCLSSNRCEVEFGFGGFSNELLEENRLVVLEWVCMMNEYKRLWVILTDSL